MDWLKKNPEKLVLILLSLIAVGFGIKHILDVRGYPQQFEVRSGGDEGDAIPAPPNGKVKVSAALVSVPLDWSDKVIEIAGSEATKKVQILRSVFIVEKDGDLYDLADPNTVPLREPVPNFWIIENSLDILNPNVLSMDPDSDGFSNVEEWKEATDPIDGASHPSFLGKLLFAERREKPLRLRFSSNLNPDFQVTVQNSKGKKTKLYKMGDTFPSGIDGGTFTIKEFVPKEERVGGIMKDTSQLILVDNASGEEVSLTLKVDKDWPSYYARFNFPLGRTTQEQDFTVKVGDTFVLALDPAKTEYRVKAVSDNSATVVEVQSGTDTEVTL